jgi:hypothetical protein
MPPQCNVRTAHRMSIVSSWFDCLDVRSPFDYAVLSSQPDSQRHPLAMSRPTTVVDRISRSILILRGHRVLLDANDDCSYDFEEKRLQTS